MMADVSFIGVLLNSVSIDNLLNIQASGRLNRTGQKHRVTSVELVAPNTLDTAEIDWLNVTAAEMKASLTNI